LAALSILVKMLNPKEIEKLRKEFEKVDTDNSGTIEANELKTAIKNANVDISDQEIDHILNELDYSGDKTINYTEFLAATIQI
jgi:Ca2+-binding EF-hand superfamily protein